MSDCEVCNSKNSFIVYGNSDERSLYCYCLNCGFGKTEKTYWNKKRRYTKMMGSVFQWDLKTINKYRGYAINEAWAFTSRKYRRSRWEAPLKKFKKMNMQVFEKKSKEMEETIKYWNNEYKLKRA